MPKVDKVCPDCLFTPMWRRISDGEDRAWCPACSDAKGFSSLTQEEKDERFSMINSAYLGIYYDIGDTRNCEVSIRDYVKSLLPGVV